MHGMKKAIPGLIVANRVELNARILAKYAEFAILHNLKVFCRMGYTYIFVMSLLNVDDPFRISSKLYSKHFAHTAQHGTAVL